jgi:hypothetical protein
MSQQIDDLIRKFTKDLAEIAPYNAVAFELFQNGSGWEYSFKNRDYSQLKKDGISMQNLRGEFIREEVAK